MKADIDDAIKNLIIIDNDLSRAFDLLLENYKKPVYYHVRRLLIVHEDADDVTQEIFIKIWKHLHSFNFKSKIFTWVYRIATNEAISFLNKKRRFLFLSIYDVEKILGDKLYENDTFSGNDIQRQLQKAILNLPQKQRIVFNLRYFDGLKYEEMAEILDTSVGALKASYHLAVKKIEKYFELD